MNILVTGGTGNLGSKLVVPLVRRGHSVTVFDVRDKPVHNSPEFESCRKLTGNLARRNRFLPVVEQGGFDAIVHLAAVLSGDAERYPDRAWAVNMEGTRTVLEGARRFGVGRVVFSSTVATFGAGLPEPVDVDAPQYPISLYGVTKVAAERLGVYYRHRFGLDFRCVRLAAVAGPRGATGGASGFCSQFYMEAVTKGRYEFYLAPDTRAPIIYVDDAVRALVALFEADESALARRVYQVNGIGPSAAEMAACLLERLPDVQITYRPDPVRNAIVRSWPSRLDDSDARRDWGWESSFDLERMTDRMLQELRTAST